MANVIAIMSMSLDGYVADADDGVAEVFDWYFSGDVEVPTASTSAGMTFHVSAPSAEHLRGLTAEVGAMLTGRRTFERADGWGGQHPWDVPAFVVTHHVPEGWPRPGSTVQFVTDGIESAVARAKSAAGPKSVGVHGAQTIQQCLDAGLLDEIHIDLACRVARRRSAAVRPPREHTGRPRESDSRHRCGCHASALSRALSLPSSDLRTPGQRACNGSSISHGLIASPTLRKPKSVRR